MKAAWLRTSILVLAALILDVAPALAAEPIRVGYMGPLTGIFDAWMHVADLQQRVDAPGSVFNEVMHGLTVGSGNLTVEVGRDKGGLRVRLGPSGRFQLG